MMHVFHLHVIRKAEESIIEIEKLQNLLWFLCCKIKVKKLLVFLINLIF